jgi:hypothetical protein
VDVNKLTPGYSGAAVFRISPKKSGQTHGEYVLKLCPAESRWKVAAEVKGQEEAKKTLGVAGYKTHIPELITPRVPSDPANSEFQYAVSFGNWFALCYDFLGGEQLGRFTDLETALVAAPKELQQMVAGTDLDGKPVTSIRLEILSIILGWLCSNWYLHPKRIVREIGKPQLIWSVEDAPAKTIIRLPPYQLTGNMKQAIHGFLHGAGEALGKRLSKDTWVDDRKVIGQLLAANNRKTGIKKLDRKLPVILSPCHGDLNANNALFWIDMQEHPFLIDFPFYQSKGHALQDFARLEVEIKLTLMDRQRIKSPPGPKAFDHTFTQVDLWKELEAHMLSNKLPAETKVWKSKQGDPENLNLSLQFLNIVRSKAIEVQDQLKKPDMSPKFFDEYLPALLYYTLRAIGFPSLSIFKRLLAVYSAGRILEWLQKPR